MNKFLASIICSFTMNHKIDPMIEEQLDDGKAKYTDCQRCDMPLRVSLDPDDNEFMLITEDCRDCQTLDINSCSHDSIKRDDDLWVCVKCDSSFKVTAL